MTATTWDPATNQGMVLSNGNTTAIDPGNIGIVDVEATTAITPGAKVFVEYTVTAGATGSALGVGFDTKPYYYEAGAGDPGNPAIYGLGNHNTNGYPASANSVFTGYDGGIVIGGNYIVEPHRGVNQYINGGYVDLAMDTVNHLFWERDNSTALWNNSTTANPSTGVGGIDISTLAGKTLYPTTMGWIVGGHGATINGGSAGFRGSVPTGFTALDSLNSSSGPAPPPATVNIGSGSDTLALNMSEDAWNGDAKFNVFVDGTQIGTTQTTTAMHSAGQTQKFNVMGNFGAGSHTATVTFVNNLYGGTPSTDRNLYMANASIDNSVVSGATLTEYSNGPQSFKFIVPGSPPSGGGTDTVSVDHPSNLASGVQTITGTESDPTQSVYLDWHLYGTPTLSSPDWVKATVNANGSFSANVDIDHSGSQSTMFYRVNSGPTMTAWSDTPS